MKAGKELKNYFRKRVSAIHALTQKNSQHFTIEDFHHFRVEIKKIKAQFKLIHFCDKKFKQEKYFEKLEKVFNKAGDVRELQLELNRLEKYKAFGSRSSYRAELKKNIIRKKKKFFNRYWKGFASTLKELEKYTIPFIKKITGLNVNKFTIGQRLEISFLLNKKKLQSDELHELRKRLKEFTYTRKSLGIKIRTEWFDQIDAFQDLLGKWHDNRVLARDLKKVIKSGKLNTRDVDRLKTAGKKISSEEKILVKKINSERGKLSV
jgi:CHAD domain-containing protein